MARVGFLPGPANWSELVSSGNQDERGRSRRFECGNDGEVVEMGQERNGAISGTVGIVGWVRRVGSRVSAWRKREPSVRARENKMLTTEIIVVPRMSGRTLGGAAGRCRTEGAGPRGEREPGSSADAVGGDRGSEPAPRAQDDRVGRVHARAGPVGPGFSRPGAPRALYWGLQGGSDRKTETKL